MLTTLAGSIKGTIRSVILFFVSPFLYIIYSVLALAARRSKTASNIILKAQLVRDVITQTPPPAYQLAVESDSEAARLQALDISLQTRENELAINYLALEREQQHLIARKLSLAKREDECSEKEKVLTAGSLAHVKAESELVSQREALENDVEELRLEQKEIRRLSDMLKEERSAIEQQRSETSLALHKLQEARILQEEQIATRQKMLDDRQIDINGLHDQFLRSHLDSMEHHRSEHNSLIESLQSQLNESHRNLEAEKQRSKDQIQRSNQLHLEFEQRCAFLTNELAERTDREFNISSELAELRRKLSDERANFNKEFGDLSRALSDLKLKCSQYENDMTEEGEKNQQLKAKEISLANLELDLKTRKDLLDAHSKTIEESENALKARIEQITDKEITLEGKAHTLRSLQATLEEQLHTVKNQDKGSSADSEDHQVVDEPPSGTDPKDRGSIPSATIPDSVPTVATSPTSTSSRPTIRQRVSRRTNEFVERVNSVAHRRSTSYGGHHSSNHEARTGSTKSQDGLKPNEQ